MPAILDILEQQLRGIKPQLDLAAAAQSHGLHRWQKSHHLPDLLREFHHLSMSLFEELRLFRQLFPNTDPDTILLIQQHIMVFINQTVGESITKLDELQRLEAANRATSLQKALQEMEELSRQRTELLRTSSHDLRSGLGLISGAAQVLNMDELTEEERKRFTEMLNRNLSNVQSSLTDLIDLARLEAGQEPLKIEEFDAAQLLTELVSTAQDMAKERGIILRADGPANLQVKTDREKVYRIAQNLVINALKYTLSTPERLAIVSVSWSTENDWRWVFSVHDSGPGLPAGLMELFHQQLKPTVEETSVLSLDEGQPVSAKPNLEHTIETLPLGKGEGIGLQITKRLCDLLNASMEIESIPERGTLIRIRLLTQFPD
ncbi:sensor histidine kinase [Spirosoma oryzicola]|uniref:sensor histidine kinase n=1 Tax=Spirosoma oryzicola TaxID=2898794 RepID=UPI001E409762|nr:HAMP domain-containing sensor histidine kinase [Spirosoma oryzicola]UHG93936.1 HAMP domain-containing histidine kinase [Spirosoma oryzicola]